MLAVIKSAACVGIKAFEIEVEVDIGFGLPQLSIVGLPDTSVKEAKERVRTAIKNSGFNFPSDKITINLAPAELKKEGPAFDLPIAIGFLCAQGVLDADQLRSFIVLGELALDGSIRPFHGAVVVAAEFSGKYDFIFPEASAQEASIVESACIYPVKNLNEVINFLKGHRAIEPVSKPKIDARPMTNGLNFSEVKGQRFAKRAIEIAVAGGHNLLFLGPPGSGKTMLAKRISTILPPLAFEEALEITKIYSAAGELRTAGLCQERPFRSPHHTISNVALTGGGSWPRPGEISLAHGGVLFLDELPEFRRDVLECLRGPLEEGWITISRTKSQITFPARFMLTAAMNPCPCGYLTDPRKPCRCSLGQIHKYQSKISGPILDRIDLHVEVPALSYSTLIHESAEETSESIRERIVSSRALQFERYERRAQVNAHLTPREIKKYLRLNDEGRRLLETALKEMRLSARGYYKILKIARTISDLAACEQIQEEHIAEAIQYRSLDRQWWT